MGAGLPSALAMGMAPFRRDILPGGDGLLGFDVTDIVFGDFNGDGILDVAQGGSSGIWLFTGRGDGTFNPSVLTATLTGAAEIAAADFNEDGKLDLVVTIAYAGSEQNQGNGTYVFLGNGDGTFQTPQHFPSPVRPYKVVAGALGGGGHAGFALSLFDNPLSNRRLLRRWQRPLLRAASPQSPVNRALEIGDINGDGIGDLVIRRCVRIYRVRNPKQYV